MSISEEEAIKHLKELADKLDPQTAYDLIRVVESNVKVGMNYERKAYESDDVMQTKSSWNHGLLFVEKIVRLKERYGPIDYAI